MSEDLQDMILNFLQKQSPRWTVLKKSSFMGSCCVFKKFSGLILPLSKNAAKNR